MKFLIFNLTVAAALFYLISADRAEFQAAAGRVHDAAGEIKSMAERAVDKGRRMLDQSSSGVQTPRPTRIAEETTKTPEIAPRPAPAPPVAPVTPVKTPYPTPVPASSIARTAAPMPPMPPIAPAVARRRAEILNGVETVESTVDSVQQDVSLKDGARMMTPAQRRKELFSLAEEMELLYARKVSR